jgi:hypothetical protein
MPKFDHRFARQNGGGPPPEFPLASSYPGIVHHLSGPNIYALTRFFQEISRSAHGAPLLWVPRKSLSLRARVCHPNTRIHVRLLGPCFKTGRLKPFRQDCAYLGLSICIFANTVCMQSVHSKTHNKALYTTSSTTPHLIGL